MKIYLKLTWQLCSKMCVFFLPLRMSGYYVILQLIKLKVICSRLFHACSWWCSQCFSAVLGEWDHCVIFALKITNAVQYIMYIICMATCHTCSYISVCLVQGKAASVSSAVSFLYNYRKLTGLSLEMCVLFSM